MRTRVLALVAIAAFASAVVVVASARTTANGLPAYTNGWQTWPKINRKPFTSTGPLSKLEIMQREMETAIAKELYERAAELRDAIKLLKTQRQA